MINRTTPRILRFALVTAFLISALPVQAEGRGFKAGQKIEWKDRITGQWTAGSFVAETPGGTQPIIQQRPGDATSQTAYDWDGIRQPPAANPPAPAGKGFKKGQTILWKDRVTGKWQEGEFVGETPGGKQPIILQQVGKANTQTASVWEEIKAQDAPAPAAKPGGTAIPPLPIPATSQPSVPPLPLPATAKPNIPPFPVPAAKNSRIPPLPLPPAERKDLSDAKPLTEAEVKQFIVAQVGDRPFDDSVRLQKAKDDLDALVKKRGTAFLHLDGKNEFGEWLSAKGFSPIGPMNHNYGPPNDQKWLFGSWVTSITGLPIHFKEGNKRITWTEIGKANTGLITINPNGTYLWNTDSPQGVIKGTWRVATAIEMDDQGGAGVVLEKAKSGDDWVAFKYRASNPDEDWLGICQVFKRANREGAIRVPAGKEAEVKVVPRR